MTQELSPSRLRQLHHALPPPHQRLSSYGLTGTNRLLDCEPKGRSRTRLGQTPNSCQAKLEFSPRFITCESPTIREPISRGSSNRGPKRENFYEQRAILR